MKTATKVVRATGPKSILESIETRAATDIKAAEARMGTAMAGLEAKVVALARVQAQHADALIKHGIDIATNEARIIDRDTKSVLRRIWAWLTHYEGIL